MAGHEGVTSQSEVEIHALVASNEGQSERPAKVIVISHAQPYKPNSWLLCCAGIIICGVTVFIVLIVAFAIALSNMDDDDYYYDSDSYYTYNETRCGWKYDADTDHICFRDEMRRTNAFYSRDKWKCADSCVLRTNSEDETYGNYTAYFVNETGECYCGAIDNCLDIDELDIDELDIDELNSSNSSNSSSSFIIHMQRINMSYECDVYINYLPVYGDGRPYNIDTLFDDLRSNLSYIDCNTYQYYDDNEWQTFLIDNNYAYDNNYDDDMDIWINQGLSEHAAIASFAKFSLELMNIGAPLWMIQLSNKAMLDEIKHTKIVFDVINMIYLSRNNNNINSYFVHNTVDKKCIIPNKFPTHKIKFDSDWNKISKDTAIGGCIGETLSVLKMRERIYNNNIIDKYLDEISMDEIRHSALAWITIKWIINNVSDDILLDISNKDWWNKQFNQLQIKSHDISIILTILDKICIDCNHHVDYKQLYQSIIHELKFQILNAPQICAI